MMRFLKPTVSLDTVDHVGAFPEPAETKACPLVPAEPVSVNAVVMFGDASVGLVKVLFVRVSVVARPTKVSVDVGSVRVPVLEIVLITGAVSVLLVRVSVVALPTKVSVAAGSVTVVVPATAVACNVVVPEVDPESSTALGFRLTVVAIFFLYGVPLETMFDTEVITPVESIDAIVVAPYLNNNFVPLWTIEKLVVTKEPAEPVVSWFRVGTSLATNALNVGTPFAPLGAARTYLAVLDA
jgi:hypothetical protein